MKDRQEVEIIGGTFALCVWLFLISWELTIIAWSLADVAAALREIAEKMQ